MALNVYCKIPFKDVHEWHPVIKKYAPIIGRSTVALKMKVGNFGRFDPELKARGITGLKNGSKAEEDVWNELATLRSWHTKAKSSLPREWAKQWSNTQT